MNSKHTPGPWTVDADLARGNRVISGAEGEVVAEVTRTFDVPDVIMDTAPDTERDGNANLIAAAPEMREEHAEQAARMRMWAAMLHDLVNSSGTGWGKASGVGDVIEGLEISATKAEVLLARIDGEGGE